MYLPHVDTTFPSEQISSPSVRHPAQSIFNNCEYRLKLHTTAQHPRVQKSILPRVFAKCSLNFSLSLYTVERHKHVAGRLGGGGVARTAERLNASQRCSLPRSVRTRNDDVEDRQKFANTSRWNLINEVRRSTRHSASGVALARSPPRRFAANPRPPPPDQQTPPTHVRTWGNGVPWKPYKRNTSAHVILRHSVRPTKTVAMTYVSLKAIYALRFTCCKHHFSLVRRRRTKRKFYYSTFGENEGEKN